MMPVMAGQMPEKAAGYHEALCKRPESEALFTRFHDAWLEERQAEDLEVELRSRAEAGEAGAWGILGRARLAAGKEDEALTAFGKAMEAEPVAAWLRLARAKMLLARNDFAAAEKDALAVPEGDNSRPEALKLAGLACLRGERVEEALAHWKKAVEAAPGDKSLLEDLTELARREGRYDLALDFCGKWREATEDAYGKAMATLKRSELLLASQRREEAMAELGEVVKVSGDGSWLEREALGRAEQIYQRQSDATGWVKQITAWAEANPVRLNFRRAQAQALAAAGQPSGALEVLAEVLKRGPGDREARWQRISLLERDLKVQQAFDECAALVAEEKSEETGLRLAELAFRLENKDEVKKALDSVIAAVDPVKQIGLAGLYARYGLPEESEKQWRAAAGGESGGQALRELAKHLRTEGREKDALEVWKEIGRRDHSQDRIDAAVALAGAGEREVAQKLLDEGRESFSIEPGYEAARAQLAMMQDRRPDAEGIFRDLARRAQRPDELHAAVKGWLGAVAGRAEEATKELGESTGDRCLRAAWLAEQDKPLPPLAAGDDLERSMRLALLREYRKWPEVVALLEASGGSGPLFLSEFCDAKFLAGDRPGALAAAKAWRERTPDQPGPWLKEADLLADSGDAAAAEALLRRAVARFDSDENVAQALFSLLEKNRSTVAALDLAWQRHDQGADASAQAGWLREIVRVSKGTQGMTDLKLRFEERARRDPASPGPLVALADLARTNGDPYEELNLMTKAVACAPRDVAIVSRLAALEEQRGWRDRALQRYAELARLVPGLDSARQLAQAKLRCGDIEGGMRDLQALAGERGLDVREMEQSAISMALRGYVEEALKLLGALEPQRVDARLNFVLGLLLEADGREGQAIDHFIKVWNEPVDPAEHSGLDIEKEPSRFTSVSVLLDLQRYQQSQEPGILQQVPIAPTLAQAKSQLPPRLLRLAMRGGGDSWDQLCVAIPALRIATVEQWRKASEFAGEGSGGYMADWWDFVRRYPDNPLGFELIQETQHYARLTAEQKQEILRREPPVPLKLALSILLAQEVTPEAIAWMEKVEPGGWQDAQAFQFAVSVIERLLVPLERDEKPDPALAERLERVLTMTEKADLRDAELAKLKFLRGRQALVNGQADAFLAGVKQALEAPDAPGSLRQVRYQLTSLPTNGVENVAYPLMNWRKRKGDAAADALIERLPSPVLRCLALQFGTKEKDACQLRALKELAALPPDAPRELRRDLTRLSWRISDPDYKRLDESKKQLRLAGSDDSDARLALEAYHLLRARLGEARGEELSPADLQRVESLVKRLRASDESDREYAKVMAQAFGQQRSPATPAVTRWGSTSGSGYSSSSGGGMRSIGTEISRIAALKDREMAVREAADLLENTARGAMGRGEVLMQPVREFKKAGLLDDALARIQLPEDAGLIRRVSMRALMDAADRKEDARAIIAGIRQQRPWETHWLLELALRSADREESFRLLDEAATRSDFSRMMGARTFDPNSSGGLVLAKIALLADWAERPQANRGWLGQAAIVIGNRIGTTKDLSGLYRRYCQLALTDPRSAEDAFGSLYQTTREKEPEVVEDAARQAMLSGAYWSTGDNRSMYGNGRGSRSQAPAAIEHLVSIAAKKGDDAVFPAEFRGKLKAVDPALESWLGTVLGTKQAMELPGILPDANLNSSPGGPEWAKHEAAMLRAIQLPGRDEFLVKVFQENKQQAVSRNLVHVIRESLTVAVKDKALEKRLLSFLEASAGPRKDWKPVQDYKLSSTCGLMLQAAAAMDSATLVGVVKSFAAWKVTGNQGANISQSLGILWRKELGEPNARNWDELPGADVRDALQLGYWKSSYAEEGEVGDDKASVLRFEWILPQAVHVAHGSDAAIAAQVAKNPEASFIDLMRAAAVSSDGRFGKRLLKLVAPELGKLPAEMQKGVIDSFTRKLDKDDLPGLSKLAAASLGKRLEREKTQRIGQAREAFKQMKSSTTNHDPDRTCGGLIGQVVSDDPQLGAEIEEYWLALKSPRDADLFADGVLGSADGPVELGKRLAYLDKFWKGEPPPRKTGANAFDPFLNAWGRIDGEESFDSRMWEQMAGLSPRMQVRVLLAGGQYLQFNRNQQQEPELPAVAKKIELLRHAHAWNLSRSKLARDSDTGADGTLLLAYARSLKASGAERGQLAEFLGDGFRYLPRLDNAEAVMKGTPELLEGIQSLPEEAAQSLVNGVASLWSVKREEWRRASPVLPNAKVNPPVYPEATASLLKFVLPKVPAKRGNEAMGDYRMNSIVLDTGDGELLGAWVSSGGQGLQGDASLVLRLLKIGKVKEAVALAPGRDGRIPSFPPFTRETEQLVKKLDEVDSPQAFRVKASLSLAPDGRGADAPDQLLAARRERLTGEFEKRAATLSVNERIHLCVVLGLIRKAVAGPVPVLDEFANEAYARQLSGKLSVRPPGHGNDPVGVLHVAAVCSRFHAGDVAGMERLTGIFKEGLGDGNVVWEISESWLPLIQATFWKYADVHDAVLPEAHAKVVLKLAGALASFPRAEWREEAATMVRLASKTPEALAAAVEAMALQGVEPGKRFHLHDSIDREARVKSLFRVAVLHPCASPDFLKVFFSQAFISGSKDGLLDLLADPKVRARLQPADFLAWTRQVRRVSPETLAFATTYFAEKKAEFNDAQRENWEEIVANLQNRMPVLRDFRYAPDPQEQTRPDR
jgi:tetratricopeptide (TPR) repeat protein